MTNTTHSAQDDLAFMRGLVDGTSSFPPAFGETYLAGGLIYGLQVLIQVALPSTAPPLVQLTAGIAPTGIFLAGLAWIIWRHRHVPPGSAVSRALNAAFGCVGLANLALICVIGSLAVRRHSLEIWLIYPCVVFVLQGLAWLVAYALRKRAWQGLVGIGWFAAAIGLALTIGSLGSYALVGGGSLIGLMAVPGAVMMRLARKPA